MGDKYKITFIL